MSPRPSRRLTVFLLVTLIVLLAKPGFANEGYQLVGIGPLQRGTAGAGVSSPEDSTWMLLNPAGIADLDRRVEAYIEVLPVVRYVIPRGVFPVVNVFSGKDEDADIVQYPSFGLVFPQESGWNFGTGMLALGGTRVDFDRSRTLLARPTNGDRRGGYEVAQIPMMMARTLDNGWSIGFGVIGNLQRLRTDTLTLNLRPAEANYAWDYAFGGGLSVGVQKRWAHWSFGASYYSRQWVTDFGKYLDIVRYNLDVPQRVQVGVGYHPTPRWDFLLDYKWIHYSSVRQLGTTTTRSGIGWDDYQGVKAGVRFRPSDRWVLRAGLTLGESPVGDDVVFANAQFPALVETTVSFGLTRRLRENADVHLAYSWTRPEVATDSGQGDLFSILGRGTEIGLKTQAVTVGVTWRF